MTAINKTILTNAVYTFGFASGVEALKHHPVYQHGGFSHPVAEFAANALPTFRSLKVAIKESTGLSLSGKASDWLPVWAEGYVSGHVATK